MKLKLVTFWEDWPSYDEREKEGERESERGRESSVMEEGRRVLGGCWRTQEITVFFFFVFPLFSVLLSFLLFLTVKLSNPAPHTLAAKNTKKFFTRLNLKIENKTTKNQT